MLMRLRSNMLANAAGRLSTMALALIFTPVYIKLLGFEAYGLIGFYIALQAAISFLELGLSRACNRELALLSTHGTNAHSRMRNTLRSLEILYWLVGILLGVGLTIATPWIANSWLRTTTYVGRELAEILLIVAWVIALRWPAGLYIGALMGLQRQVLCNGAQFMFAVLSWGGAAVALWLWRMDLQTFFYWQLLIAIAYSICFASLAWFAMPKSESPKRFDPALIQQLLPFAMGVAGTTIVGTILNQADKLILSTLLPLGQFGFYAIAAILAEITVLLAMPISTAVFPRFSQLVRSDCNNSHLSSLYKMSCQMASILIIPFALLATLFAKELLFSYTGSLGAAAAMATVLPILAVAKMLQALMVIPYALQLAYGWVSLSFTINFISMIWFVPATYWSASTYGPLGPAITWLVLGLVFVAVGIPVMHRKLLPGQWKEWLWHSFTLPLLASGSFLLLARWLFPVLPSGQFNQGLVLVLFGVTATALAAVASKDLRSYAYQNFESWKSQ